MFQKIYYSKLVFIFILCSSFIGSIQATIVDCSVWNGKIDNQEKKVITIGEVHLPSKHVKPQTEAIQELCTTLDKQGKKVAVLLELMEDQPLPYPTSFPNSPLIQISNWAHDNKLKIGTIDFIKADDRHIAINQAIRVSSYLDPQLLLSNDFLKKLVIARKKELTKRLKNENIFDFIKKLKQYKEISDKDKKITSVQDLEQTLTHYNSWNIFAKLLKKKLQSLAKRFQEKELPVSLESFANSFPETIKKSSKFNSPLLKELTIKLESKLNEHLNPFIEQLKSYDNHLSFIDLLCKYIETNHSLSLDPHNPSHIFTQLCSITKLDGDIGFINHLYNALENYDVVIVITGCLHSKNIKKGIKEKKFTNKVNDESKLDFSNLIPVEPDSLKNYFKSVLE